MTSSPTSQSTPAALPPSVFTLPQTAQLEALYTIIRDRTTSRGDFLFYSDRIIRLLVEEGLNHLPVVPKTVETPTVRAVIPIVENPMKNNVDLLTLTGGEIRRCWFWRPDMRSVHLTCWRGTEFALDVENSFQICNLGNGGRSSWSLSKRSHREDSYPKGV